MGEDGRLRACRLEEGGEDDLVASENLKTYVGVDEVVEASRTSVAGALAKA